MNDEPRTYRTKTGRILTDADIEALADEAERGYDVEQYRITDGRILSVGNKHRRDNPLRADYVLECRPGLPIASVEAKRSAPGTTPHP